MFTFCTLVTSVILYQGLKASATQIITVVLGFLVICTGIFILQMSKVDPRELTNVDRRTTLLLQAARVEIDPKSARDLERDDTSTSRLSRRRTVTSTHSHSHNRVTHAPVNGTDLEALADGDRPRAEPHVLVDDVEAGLVYSDLEEEARAVVEKTEDPGIDSLRGTFGTIGTIIRARRRATALSHVYTARSRTSSSGLADDLRTHSRSPRGTRGTGATVKESSDLEKAEFRGDAFGSPAADGDGRLVASPLSTSGSPEARRVTSVHFNGSESAPVTLERTDVDRGDPMREAGAAIEEAARMRAQTLPNILDHERMGADIIFLKDQSLS